MYCKLQVLYPECVKRGVDVVPDYYTAYVDVRHAFARMYACDEVNMALNEMMAGTSPILSVVSPQLTYLLQPISRR
jgi:hypothetical protein